MITQRESPIWQLPDHLDIGIGQHRGLVSERQEVVKAIAIGFTSPVSEPDAYLWDRHW